MNREDDTTEFDDLEGDYPWRTGSHVELGPSPHDNSHRDDPRVYITGPTGHSIPQRRPTPHFNRAGKPYRLHGRQHVPRERVWVALLAFSWVLIIMMALHIYSLHM